MIRVLNLEAGPGLIKAAGAAPDWLATETMLIVEMRVKQADYIGSLSIALDELTVIQENFADKPWAGWRRSEI